MRAVPLLFVLACAEGSVADDSNPVDAGTAAPSLHDWSPVDAALDAAWQEAPSDLPGFSVLLWDRSGTLIYSESRGEFDNTERIPVASASKLISALTLLRLIETDVLSLDNTTGEVLGWTGDGGDVTLDQLGGFVSGFEPQHGCHSNPFTTLQACAQTIGQTEQVAQAGTLFEYGSSHLQVAGAMAETRLDEPWNDLFRDVLAEPVGLVHADLRYVALPRSELGERNPRVAGGLLASPAEYGEMLTLVLAEGQLNGESFIAPELIDRMFRNPYTTAATGRLPQGVGPIDWRYSFGSWLECPATATECDVISSAGAFGMVPWVDRDTGYTGLISMNGRLGVTEYGLGIEGDIQPLIIEILSQDD